MNEDSNKTDELEIESSHPPEEEGSDGALESPVLSSAPPGLELRLNQKDSSDDDYEESTIVDLKRLVANDLAESISDLPPPADPLLLGKYSVIYPFAVGKMSTVNVGHNALSNDTSRVFAIKFVHGHLIRDGLFMDAFRRETKLRKSIRHPNVARIFDVEDKKNRCVTVEELVLGQNLGAVISRAMSLGIRLPDVILAEILVQVCNGLQTAYEEATANEKSAIELSGALCPSNIVISYHGAVKLVDFGLTWGKERLSKDALDTTAETFGFMAPEYALGNSRDQQGDVFTLGVLLYLLATNELPFQGESEAERLGKLITAEYVTPRAARPDINGDLLSIINRALSYFSAERFSTIEEMSGALADFATQAREQVEETSLSTYMQQLFPDEISQHDATVQDYYNKLLRPGGTQTDVALRKKGFWFGLGGNGAATYLKRFLAIAALICIALIVTKVFVKDEKADKKVAKSPVAFKHPSKGKAPAPVPAHKAGVPDSPTGEKTTPKKEGKPPIEPNSEKSENPTVNAKKTADAPEKTKTAKTTDAPEKTKKAAVTIKLSGLKKGASVYLGKKRMTPPLEIAASEKTTTLRVEAPGYETFEKNLTPNRDQTVRVNLIKEKTAAAKPKRREPKKADPTPKNKKRRERKKTDKKKPSGWEANPFG